MAYRTFKPHRPKPQRSIVDIATPVRFYIHNGTMNDFALPCWYQEIYPPIPARVHNRMLHDHHGWPGPRHPDHSCQLWIPEAGHCIHGMQECHPHCKHYINYSNVFPIHLSSEYEGYTGVSVAWVEEPEGISINAYIDPVEDWVVRIDVDCMDPNAIEEPQVYKFTVFVNKANRRDIVALAELIVLPSAYERNGNA